MTLSDSSFRIFAEHVKTSSGLVLRDDQEYLLTARLSAMLELFKCADLNELAALLKSGADEKLARLVTEAMATHETSFFRDAKMFAFLRDTILPDLAARLSPVRFWSAGCSSGQEAYSIAMLLDERRDDRSTIMASDFSSAVIERAAKGLFTHFEAQRGLPARMLVEYFDRYGDHWAAKDILKRRIDFSIANLLDDTENDGLFDVVLCRNVMIYIDPPTRAKILARLMRAVRKQGYLIVGAVETIPPVSGWICLRDAAGVFKRL